VEYDKIEIVEFDLNTVCNSYCPPCHRHIVQDGELYHNPYVKLNTQIELSVIEKILSSSLLVDYCCIDLVGLVGEPVAHPKIMEIIDMIYKYRPNAAINLHTNGGLKTEKFYYDLGQKFNKWSVVKFALDGLEDTLGIYRIGVSYTKAVANMRAFIAGGGRGKWKMVIFPWNEHQVEEANRRAIEYGCDSFTTVANSNSNSMDPYMAAAQKKIHKKVVANKGDDIKTEPLNGRKIEDQCFSENKVYVNAHGFVIPCCMVNGALTYETMRNPTLQFIKEDRDPDWNSLYINSFDDIMNDTWWKKLKDSFTDTPCDICVYACAK